MTQSFRAQVHVGRNASRIEIEIDEEIEEQSGAIDDFDSENLPPTGTARTTRHVALSHAESRPGQRDPRLGPSLPQILPSERIPQTISIQRMPLTNGPHGHHLLQRHPPRLSLFAKRTSTPAPESLQPNVSVETARDGIADRHVGPVVRPHRPRLEQHDQLQSPAERAVPDPRLRKRFRAAARPLGDAQTFRHHQLIAAESERRRADRRAPVAGGLLHDRRPPERQFRRSCSDPGHPGAFYRIAQTLRPLENGAGN